MKLRSAVLVLLVLGWLSPALATDVVVEPAAPPVAEVPAAPVAEPAAPVATPAEVPPAPAPEAKVEPAPAPVTEAQPAPEAKAEEKTAPAKDASAPVKEEVKPPVTDEDAGKAVGTAVDLAKQGMWTAVVGFILMLLVWFARRIGILNMVPPKAVPWVTLVLGCVTAVGLVLAGGQGWDQGLVSGGGGAMLATALWEYGFKTLLGKPPVKTVNPS